MNPKKLMECKEKYDSLVDEAAKDLLELIPAGIQLYKKQFQYDILKALAKKAEDKAQNIIFDD